jgi:hypothetical protein
MVIWAASPPGSTAPLFGGRPQDLVLHGQLVDLAFGLLERPIIWRTGLTLTLVGRRSL